MIVKQNANVVISEQKEETSQAGVSNVDMCKNQSYTLAISHILKAKKYCDP
jgi:hypothetical protein